MEDETNAIFSESFNVDEVFDGVQACQAFVFFLSSDFTEVRPCRQGMQGDVSVTPKMHSAFCFFSWLPSQ